MEFSVFMIMLCICSASAVCIMPELKHNVLRFGYGVNFIYERVLSHSFHRFYVITKIEIPKVSDLHLTMFQFFYNCSHVINMQSDSKRRISNSVREMFEMYCKI